MSEKQAWRPSLAPKPSSASFPATNDEGRDPSPAVRGASLAFGPASGKPTTTAPSKISNAAIAAAAAGRARQQPLGGGHNAVRTAASPVRGRSQLTLDLEQAARKLQTLPTSSHIASAPTFHPTTSEIAARAASASTSPARNSESAASRGASPDERIVHSSTADASDITRGRVGRQGGDEALQGAIVSMSASPTSKARSPFSNSQGKLDVNRISSPAASSTEGSSSAHQVSTRSGTSGTRSASAGAERRLREAARALHGDSPQADAENSIQKPPELPLPTTATPVSSAITQAGTSQTQPSIDTTRASKSPTKKPSPKPTPASQTFKPPHRSGTSGFSPKDDMGALTSNTLADAMVASSLASSRGHSRAPSPKRPKPPPIPHRRSRSLNTRATRPPPEYPALKPMPVRPLRQTLRKHSPKDGDEDDTKRGRKHILRKHPNMHHEGDRKRWRDKITERERKRYEGVWAANRGLLHQHDATDLVRHRSKGAVPEDQVLNVVVRDIWERSRLPRDVLEEIWDLVSEEESRSLSREEFVVGMWLIDQRLKGRKLPVKVSPSVWSSVRHTQGVKIRTKPL